MPNVHFEILETHYVKLPEELQHAIDKYEPPTVYKNGVMDWIMPFEAADDFRHRIAVILGDVTFIAI